MSSLLTKRVAAFSFAGICALAMVVPVINAPSAHAAGHRFGISETFWIRVDGRVTHQFSLIEQSNFITEEVGLLDEQKLVSDASVNSDPESLGDTETMACRMS